MLHITFYLLLLLIYFNCHLLIYILFIKIYSETLTFITVFDSNLNKVYSIILYFPA